MPSYSGMWSISEQFQAQGQDSWSTPIVGATGYTIPGCYSWVAPSRVYSVSVVAVGGGGGGGGGPMNVNNVGAGVTANYASGPGGTGGNGYVILTWW